MNKEEFLNQIEKMSVLELNDLVKAIEEKFGVSAAAVAAAPAAAADTAAATKDSYTVYLAAVGEQKIPVMKVVKEVLGLGLKEAKDLVEGAPCNLKENMKASEAEAFKKSLSEAGATVELK